MRKGFLQHDHPPYIGLKGRYQLGNSDASSKQQTVSSFADSPQLIQNGDINVHRFNIVLEHSNAGIATNQSVWLLRRKRKLWQTMSK